MQQHNPPLFIPRYTQTRNYIQYRVNTYNTAPKQWINDEITKSDSGEKLHNYAHAREHTRTNESMKLVKTKQKQSYAKDLCVACKWSRNKVEWIIIILYCPHCHQFFTDLLHLCFVVIVNTRLSSLLQNGQSQGQCTSAVSCGVRLHCCAGTGTGTVQQYDSMPTLFCMNMQSQDGMYGSIAWPI